MQSVSSEDIAGMLPHSGNMVLLDAVIGYDADAIHCVATRHHASDNPLRIDGRLPAWCGIEYAAQAMAVHQRVCAARGTRPSRGFLAVVRDVVLGPFDLDGVPGDLHIHAEKVVAESGRSLYLFRLLSGGQAVLSGRAAVVLQGTSE